MKRRGGPKALDTTPLSVSVGIERVVNAGEHGVVRRDVLPQLPRPSQEIEMGVTVEIEIGEIRNRVGRSVS